MAIFKRGFNSVKEEKKRQEEMVSNRGLFRFYLKNDGDEAELTFLTEEPVNYYEHGIKKYKNGKEIYENIPCTGDKSCPHCKNGDNPSFKSAWLVIDHREFEYESNGKKQKGSDQLRLFIYGTKVASNLDRISNKYGLENHRLTMVRLGKGTSTTYTFERGDILDIDPDDISELMSDDMKKMYDGSTESLYEILENEIMKLVPNKNVEEEDEDDMDDSSSFVSLDDEEEEKPKSKFSNKKFSKVSKENSVKKKTSIKNMKKR